MKDGGGALIAWKTVEMCDTEPDTPSTLVVLDAISSSALCASCRAERSGNMAVASTCKLPAITLTTTDVRGTANRAAKRSANASGSNELTSCRRRNRAISTGFNELPGMRGGDGWGA